MFIFHLSHQYRVFIFPADFINIKNPIECSSRHSKEMETFTKTLYVTFKLNLCNIHPALIISLGNNSS